MSGIIAFFSANKWARWALAIVAIIIGAEAIKRHLKEAGRKAERDANAIKQAQEQQRMDAVRNQQSEDNHNAATRADETASSVPWVRTRDELRRKSPADAAILLDPAEPSDR